MRSSGPRRPIDTSEAIDIVTRAHARSAILVEGWSDQAAVEAWARRCAVDLGDHAIVVLPVGGITNLAKFLTALRAPGLVVRTSGLYDVGEERLSLRCLEKAGLGAPLSRAQAEASGFFGCVDDLEDELIRALGASAVEALLDAQDELRSFRLFQRQPAQQGRDPHGQLRRFLRTRAGRKIRYGRLLVAALEPALVPLPLRRVLSHAMRQSRTAA